MKTVWTLCVLLLALSSVAPGQTLLVEDFQYTLGDTLGGPWVRHSGTKPDSIAAGLTYAGYPGSGIGNAVQMVNGNDADYNSVFAAQTSGTVYASFLVNVKNASATGRDYFFHFMENPVNSSNIRGRVYCGKNAGDSVFFGLSFGSGGTTVTPNEYSLNTTYLFVLKMTVGAGTTDDSVSLFIFTAPTIPSAEPAIAELGPLRDTNVDLVNAGAVALRQGSSNTPSLRVDGIRVSRSWAPLFTTSVERLASDQLPAAMMLHDNFPNPFNPSTIISYQLSTSGVVSLKVFDVLGKEVATLANEPQDAGYYQVRFDASGLSSGTYLCRLTAGSYVATKRLLLMK